ncbi:GTPase IMAP family member 9-like [Osmerus mordax]|uniref:GTPase IMAP family member 9-like n=1 Tax=Osmerus mordax TaxID=8014 RepID=UPI00350F018B
MLVKKLSQRTEDKMDVRIILVGSKGSGKRCSQRTILDLKQPQSKLQKAEGEVSGRTVTMVDTPGWYNDLSSKKTPVLVKKQIESSVLLCLPGPHAFFLVINVETPFREGMRKSVEDHMKLLGERVWHYSVILFTHGDWLEDKTIEEHIESEGKALQWLVEKCENRYHVLNNINPGDRSQVTELLDEIKKMVARRNVEPFHRVKVEDLKDSDDETVEEDWAFYREMTQGIRTRKTHSFPFVTPSLNGEKRSEVNSRCTSGFSSFKSASRRTLSSGYRSLKSTSESISSDYGSCSYDLRSMCRSDQGWGGAKYCKK